MNEIDKIVQKYEVPQEFHEALWKAYEAGAEYGFFKALSPTEKQAEASDV